MSLLFVLSLPSICFILIATSIIVAANVVTAVVIAVVDLLRAPCLHFNKCLFTCLLVQQYFEFGPLEPFVGQCRKRLSSRFCARQSEVGWLCFVL